MLSLQFKRATFKSNRGRMQIPETFKFMDIICRILMTVAEALLSLTPTTKHRVSLPPNSLVLAIRYLTPEHEAKVCASFPKSCTSSISLKRKKELNGPFPASRF